MRKDILAAAVTCSFASLVATSTAQAHLVNLYYDSFGGFVEGSQHTTNVATPVVFSGDRDPHDDHNAVLDDGNDAWTETSWGVATGSGGPFSGRSGLRLSGYNDNVVQTESAILVPFGDLIHFNEPITDAGGYMDGVTVSWNLHLFPDLATAQTNDPSLAVFDFHQEFSLDIWETDNITGTCPNAAASGTVVGTGIHGNQFISTGNNQSVCDDAFAFAPIAGQTGQFTYDNELYQVVISGFYDANSLTQTFWSPEGGSHTGYVKLEIRAVNVPEPTSVALLGAGLLSLSLGGVRFRKKLTRNQT